MVFVEENILLYCLVLLAAGLFVCGLQLMQLNCLFESSQLVQASNTVPL